MCDSAVGETLLPVCIAVARFDLPNISGVCYQVFVCNLKIRQASVTGLVQSFKLILDSLWGAQLGFYSRTIVHLNYYFVWKAQKFTTLFLSRLFSLFLCCETKVEQVYAILMNLRHSVQFILESILNRFIN